jgi:hypothetical protein
MKVDLPVEEGYFNITSSLFCGLECFLITPQIDAKWNDKNLHFRSLILDKEKNVLSCGFPKFFNYGEKPECYPDPLKYNDWKILNKIDGSLVIVDFINEIFSMRTRGTVSYKHQDNYKDFEILPEKYPFIFDFLKRNQKYSLLFEILTPNNVIVVRPKKIEFYFLGAVNKENLKIVSGEELTSIWRQIGCVPVPDQYDFGSKVDLKILYNTIKEWKGKEGIVLVYNNDQNRIKFKSDWYCFIHRIKSQLKSTNNLVEYYIDLNFPIYEDFYKKIEIDFDFELAEQLKDEIIAICNAGEKTKNDLDEIKNFCLQLKNLKTRKEQAEYIIKTYAAKNKTQYAFSIIDGKDIQKNQLKKLICSNL